MTRTTFNRLLTILQPYIKEQTAASETDTFYIHNGPITADMRLGAALRYYSGGCPLDIMSVFGMSHTEVLASVTIITKAINSVPDFVIEYPYCHTQQKKIANQFHQKSGADFSVCAGAIDGILIWILKPHKKECEKVGCASA